MIPASYKTDFSAWRVDLLQRGLDRLLGQFRSSCVLRQFTAALLDEVLELHEAAIDLMEQRTLYAAAGENLDALGRIVGEPRSPYQYDESKWMFADRLPQSPDRSGAWLDGVAFESFIPVRDPEYKLNILARIMKNHALTASAAELAEIGPALTGYDISFEKTGPNQVRLLVPSDISGTALALYQRAASDGLADKQYAMPYPATLEIADVVVFTPKGFFCADRSSPQAGDLAPCAVGATQKLV